MSTHRILLGSAVLCALVSALGSVACGTSAKKNTFYPSGDGGPDTNTGDGEDAAVLNPTPTGSQTDVGDHPATDAGRTDASRGGTTGGGTVEGGTDSGPTGPVYCTGPLAAGDVFTVRVPGIGELTNPVEEG